MNFVALTLALSLLASFSSAWAQEPTDGPEAAIDRDREASKRYLGIRLKREKLLLERGAEAAALKLEEDCLRHEVKCLERYVWYLKRAPKLAGKAKSLAAALDELRKKDPKASLEERKKGGFQIAEQVSNPLGVKEAKPSEPTSGGKSTEGPSPVASTNKPSRSVTLTPDGRFEGVRPPPGSETPPETPAPAP